MHVEDFLFKAGDIVQADYKHKLWWRGEGRTNARRGVIWYRNVENISYFNVVQGPRSCTISIEDANKYKKIGSIVKIGQLYKLNESKFDGNTWYANEFGEERGPGPWMPYAYTDNGFFVKILSQNISSTTSIVNFIDKFYVPL